MRDTSRFKLRRFTTYALAVIVSWSFAAFSETYTGEPSNRVTINLGNTPWKYMKDQSNSLFPAAKAKTFNDISWENVGVPHCFNALNTYLNVVDGICWWGDITTYTGSVWYRKHFTLDSSRYKGRRVLVEFQGVNIGCAVYVNGTFKPGITVVPQPGEVTHVTGYLPFVIDVTNDIIPGADNVIAVRVSNQKDNTFYTSPIIGTNMWFGMGMGGIIRPVYMHITDPVHVPLNVYPSIKRWGTYVATTEASQAKAIVRIQTNVYNDHAQSKTVTVITKIVDAEKRVVATQTSTPQTINSNANYIFDQTATVDNPTLWYPNASIHGKPYMYKVYHIVQVGSTTVDVFESPLGIRMITWDKKFVYFNGHKHLLWGFGSRYEYPALGMAVPDEQHWRDVQLIAECGGRLLRPGHVPCASATVAACDAYGVCLFENTMDDEWKIKGEPAVPYKKEFHRDCIIRDRNNPSVVVWELDNGPGQLTGINKPLIDTIKKWDFITPRTASTRGGEVLPSYKPSELIVGYCNEFKVLDDRPTWNAEAWMFSSVRYWWDSEVQHANGMISEFRKVRDNNGCAWAHWMLSESQGEAYRPYIGESGYNMSDWKKRPTHKSLGASAMDQNRMPKLIYDVWKNALWMPYSLRPGVALQRSWNYSPGNRTVSAFSNCPKVELFVKGISKGSRTPDPMTAICEWTNVAWESGTLRAEGQDAGGKTVCFEERKSSGTPHHIVLTVEKPLVKPDGEAFKILANGSDAGFVLATIVDSLGIWCPLAANNLTFSTNGPGTYVGSANFLNDPAKEVTYHAPGDRELMAEGGQMKVAVRSTFTSGTVTVSASSPGLGSGSTFFQTYPVPLDPATAIEPRAGISLHSNALPQNRTLKIVGNSFSVPKEYEGKSVGAAVYDLSGKLLHTMAFRAGKTRPGYKLPRNGVYIIRYKVVTTTVD